MKDLPILTGNCDTCEYALRCRRASCTGSALKALFGCPEEIVGEFRKNLTEAKKDVEL